MLTAISCLGRRKLLVGRDATCVTIEILLRENHLATLRLWTHDAGRLVDDLEHVIGEMRQANANMTQT